MDKAEKEAIAAHIDKWIEGNNELKIKYYGPEDCVIYDKRAYVIITDIQTQRNYNNPDGPRTIAYCYIKQAGKCIGHFKLTSIIPKKQSVISNRYAPLCNFLEANRFGAPNSEDLQKIHKKLNDTFKQKETTVGTTDTERDLQAI